MRHLLTIVLLLAMHCIRAQQESAYRLVLELPIPAADAFADHLGNLYIFSNEGQVKKLGPKGDSVAVFNSIRRNGKLFSADVSNPLRPLLFYRDFAQVVILDRFLAQQQAVDLRRSGILQPVAVCQSFDNRIWVFDALTQKLKKVADDGKILQETPDLRAVFPEGLQPEKIVDQNSWVYLYDPAQGVFVFDYFGNFKRKMPLSGWKGLTIADNQVWGAKNDSLLQYNTTTLMQSGQMLPEPIRQCRNIRLCWPNLIAVCASCVRVYQISR